MLEALKLAHLSGLTHAVIFDSYGQHDAVDIPRIIALSKKHSEATALGVPIFSENDPSLGVKLRRIDNWWTNFQPLSGSI